MWQAPLLSTFHSLGLHSFRKEAEGPRLGVLESVHLLSQKSMSVTSSTLNKAAAWSMQAGERIHDDPKAWGGDRGRGVSLKAQLFKTKQRNAVLSLPN